MVRIRSAFIATALSVATIGGSQPASPTRTFHDSAYKISFDYPAAWNFSQTDREISSFRLDARSAPRNASMRAVIAMPENPFPLTTFSGAYLYFSVTPRSSEAACTKQASVPAKSSPVSPVTLAGIPFTHGYGERKNICIVQRDEIYTARHRGVCYRFDLAINTFCGGQVSGVKDIGAKELDQVRARLQAILATTQFDPR